MWLTEPLKYGLSGLTRALHVKYTLNFKTSINKDVKYLNNIILINH